MVISWAHNQSRPNLLEMMKFDGITRSNIILECTNYIIVLTKKNIFFSILYKDLPAMAIQG